MTTHLPASATQIGVARQSEPTCLPSHWTIIYKLMMYFTRSRFRNHPHLWYLHALGRILFRIVLMFSVMIIIRQQWDMRFLIIVASGLLPFYLFRRPASFLAPTIPASRVVIRHPYVTHLHLVIARFLLEAATTIFAGVVIFCVLIACGVAPLPRDPLAVFLPCIVLLLLGLGTGTLAAFTFPLSSAFGVIFRILLRILHITAAISFFGRALPPRLMEWALWNPVYHGVELFREAYFEIQSNPEVSFWYPSAWAAGLFLLGIAIERVVHSELDEEQPDEAEQTAAMESSLI